MLHIDGNHDTKYVMEDVELFLPLLKPNSIVVMDDIDWDSVKPAYEKLKETTTVIFESTTFAILINNKIQEEIVKEYEFELNSTYNIIEGLTKKLFKTEQIKRLGIKKLYIEQLKDLKHIKIPEMPKNATDSCQYFPIIIEEGFPMTRDKVYQEFKKYNVFTRKYFYPICSDYEPYKCLN